MLTSLIIGCTAKKHKEKVIDRDLTEFLVPPTENYENIIGFKCFAAGSSTEVVKIFEDLLQKANYTEIALHLNNSNPAYKVVATVLTEKLMEKRKLKSNSFIERAFDRNKNSWELVYFCSGCTFNSFAPMWECFQPDFFLDSDIKIWFHELEF